MKKTLILICTTIFLASCGKYKMVRTVPLPNYYSEITAAQADTMINEFNQNNKFKKALAILQPNPTNVNDSSFVRLAGYALKKEIIDNILSKPNVAGIGIFFGQNGYDKKGWIKRANINLVIVGLDINGKQLRSIGYVMYDKIPPCTGAGCNFQ